MDPASLHPLVCFAYQIDVWMLSEAGGTADVLPPERQRVRDCRMQFSEFCFTHEFLLANFLFNHF